MSKQLSVLRRESDSPRDVPAPENSAPSASDRAPGDHYHEALGTLLTDAFARKAVSDLANALARASALIAFRCEPEATGHMLREMGECLRLFAEHRRSEREAEELKENGVKPH